MTDDFPLQTRESFNKLRRLLLMGLAALVSAVGALMYFDIAPLVPVPPIPSPVVLTVCAGELLFGWFWARPKIPRRSPATSVEAYWQDPNTTRTANTMLFFFEAGAMLALVWTLLSGSMFGFAVTIAGMLAIAFHSAERLERVTL